MFRRPDSRRRLGGITVILAAATLAPASASASTVLVDFDAVNATAGPVSGSPLATYLAGYGITISNVIGAGGPQVANAGTGVFLYPNFFAPPSLANFLQQAATATPSAYRLNFAESLTSLSFTRAAMNPEMSITGMIAGEWTARALDSSGNTLAQVGEPNYASYDPVPAATFTFSTPGIAALVVERPVQVVSPTPTTVYSPAIDNLVMVTALPEPRGFVATAAAVAMLAAAMLRRRQG